MGEGLLEFLRTPAGQGLLATGLGIAASAGRGGPVNALGRGGLMGLQAYTGAQDAQARLAEEGQQREVRTMQLEQMRNQAADEKLARETAARYFTPATPGAGGVLDSSLPPEFRTGAAPVPGQPAKFDLQGYAQARMGQNPLKGIELMTAIQKDTPFNKIDPKDYTQESIAKYGQTRNAADLVPVRKNEIAPNGQVYNPYGIQPGTVFADPNKAFTINAGGQAVPNAAYQNYEINKARAGASNVSVNTGQKGLENELKIRSDFRSEPIYKAHQEVQSAHSQITASLKQNSPAGDLAGATKIMKILDPGSVVRESELGMAMAASGALDRLQHYATNVINGTKLTPKQRQDFQTLADKLYSESGNQYNAKRGEYEGFANDYGLNANRIVGPAVTSPKLPTPRGAPTSQQPKFLGFE